MRDSIGESKVWTGLDSLPNIFEFDAKAWNSPGTIGGQNLQTAMQPRAEAGAVAKRQARREGSRRRQAARSHGIIEIKIKDRNPKLRENCESILRRGAPPHEDTHNLGSADSTHNSLG